MNTKLKLATLGLITAGLVSIAPAFAASTTNTLNVSATVTGNCKFNSAGPTALTIANSGANIDPSVAVDASGTANVLYRCTSGTTAAVTAANGTNASGAQQRVRDGVTANYMNYALALAGGGQTGSGFGSAANDKTLVVTGTIVQADFVNAAAGAYTDTVVLTITP
jgi:spore coat protein U-like protein